MEIALPIAQLHKQRCYILRDALLSRIDLLSPIERRCSEFLSLFRLLLGDVFHHLEVRKGPTQAVKKNSFGHIIKLVQAIIA